MGGPEWDEYTTRLDQSRPRKSACFFSNFIILAMPTIDAYFKMRPAGSRPRVLCSVTRYLNAADTLCRQIAKKWAQLIGIVKQCQLLPMIELDIFA